MTQILIHRSGQGISLATDSRAVVYSDECEDESEQLTVRKVFHPLPNVLLVTGGAGYGQWLCETFERYIVENGLDDVADAAEAALPLLQLLLGALKKEYRPSIDRPHLDRCYVVVAGIHRSDTSLSSVDVHLFVSDHASDPMHAVDVEQIVTIPRQVTLEYRLSRMREEEFTLDEVEKLFEKFLLNAAEVDEDVGPPFHFVRIQVTGIHWRTSKEEPMEGDS